MPVTIHGTTLLFCEGRPESLDASLLNRLLRGQTNKLIVPANGKHGFRAFIEGHLAAHAAGNQRLQPPRFVGFRDRDFDVPPPAIARLIRLAGDKPIFLSYRACVENYLLDPELIREYWDESSTGPNWRHGASPSVNAIDEWLDAAARDIAHYQATRWALAGVKPDARWPEVSTTWTKGSGHLPADLDADSCLDRARRLVDQYAAQTDTVSRERLETFFGQYDRQFSDEAFFGQKAYLVWFHGKDLQRAMGRLQPKWISLPSFFPWAVAHISEESFDDLVELKTILST